MAAGGRHKAIIEVAGRVEGAEKELKKLQKQLAKLEKSQQNLNKVSAEGASPVKQGKDWAGMAAKLTLAYDGFQQLTQGLKAYGTEARRIEGIQRNQKFGLDEARRSTQGMVSDLELMRLGNSAASLGISRNSKEFADFARAADLAGRKLGLGPVESMESLNAALGRGSSEMLDNLGIVLKKADAERIYASQLGKLRSQLTDVEKAEAFRVVGMQKVIEQSKSANDEMSTGTKLAAQFSTAMQNLEDNVHNLPALFGELATEIQHAYQAWTGFDDEVNKAADGEAWFSFRDTAVAAMAPILAITDGIRTNLERINTLRNGSGISELVAGAGQKAAFKQRASSLARPENAMALMQGLGAVGLDAVNIAQGAGMTFADSIADPADARRRGGGGRGQRRTIGSRQGSTAALDIGTLSLDARNQGRAGMLEREASELERVMELEAMRSEQTLSQATSDEQRHTLIMMGLDQQAKLEEQIFSKRIEAAMVAGDMAEVRDLEHEREVYRLGVQYEKENEIERARQQYLENERRRTQERIKLTQSWLSAGTSTLNEYGQTYQAFAAAAGASEEARRKAGLRVQGALTIGEAALSLTRALSATAAGNIPGAVAGYAGAAFGFSRGALMLAGGIPSPRGGGGGGGGGQGGVMGTTFAGGGGGIQGSANAPGSRVPGSPSAADGRAKPRGTATQAERPNVIVNYSPGVQVGQADQETAEELASLVARGGMGSYNA